MSVGERKKAAQPSRAWEALSPALSGWVLEAMASMGFDRMTPVQSSTIPYFVKNSDVVVEAVTGSGKTLSFLIPVVERLLRLEEPIKKHHIGAIIISPTRELATQTQAVLNSLLAFHEPSAASLRPDDDQPQSFPASTLKVTSQLLLGGTTTPAQDLSYFLKHSPNLIIATPGRLLELLSSKHVHCPQSSFEVLVLDEADRLLDLGFKDDLQKILSLLPKQRRTGLFSASVSEAVDQLIRVGLRNPVKITVKVKSATGGQDKKTPTALQLAYLTTPPTHKLPALNHLLTHPSIASNKVIVYLSTCASVDYHTHLFPALFPSHRTVSLHGKHPPKVRNRNFAAFADATAPTILLTTDVAARGLDIPSVDLVVQLDPPKDPKDFIHRCGRAGRAGRRGLAVTFLLPGSEVDGYVPFLAVRKTPIEPLHDVLNVEVTVTDNEASRYTAQIRDLVLLDRAIHDKAQRAFVSWVQAYSRHAAASIFRVSELDWRALGLAWGLLKLPKMPEARKWDGERSLGFKVDWKDYKYKDKVREQQRLAAEEAWANGTADAASAAAAAKRAAAKRKSEAWSGKKGEREVREERREKRAKRREGVELSKMTGEERREREKLKEMIAEVRKQTLEGGEEEWGGFDG